MKRKFFLVASIAMMLGALQVAAQDNAQRGKHFDDSNYSMFIHWGSYSNYGCKWKGKTYYGIGEWLMNNSMANIPVSDYMNAAKQFNPQAFDAEAIVQLAKDAGMKYIVITSKHHEGFAMFKSKASKFNIADFTPFGRDPMKELADACHRNGLGFGFYYSHFQDWTAPGGGGGPAVDYDGNSKTFDDYFHNKCLPQVEEITSNYGDIELIWFDTPGGIPREYAEELVKVVRRNQPNALVSGRVGYDLGDYETLGDMEIPIENMKGRWETIDVTNDSWSYAWYDNNWKTPKTILQTLLTTVARGGTFMLNVGPDGQGQIPEQAQMALRGAGKWIARYPQVVYASNPSPWGHKLPWGEVITKDNKMYLAVYEWPRQGKLWLHGLNNTTIKDANLLNGKKKTHLKWQVEGEWTCINVPSQAPDSPVSIVELTVTGNAAEAQVDKSYAADPEIGIKMSPILATTQGCKTEKKSWMEKFGEWKHTYSIQGWNKDASASWDITIKDAGYYMVDLTYQGKGRMAWRVSTDEGKSIQNQQNAASVYHTYPIGWIKFDNPGKHTIKLELLEGQMESANLNEISLSPVADL